MTLGFYFDAARCAGCHVCQVACKDRMDLQTAGAVPRRVTTFEAGAYPEASIFHMSIGCNHCEKPACVANCPTGAMYKDAESGIVLHDDDVCIGCRSCMASCPYGAPQFDEELQLIVKCDSCKALRDAGMNPGVRRRLHDEGARFRRHRGAEGEVRRRRGGRGACDSPCR